MKTLMIYILISVLAVIAASAYLICIRLLKDLPGFKKEMKPLELKLLTANVGNANILRVLSRFKLNKTETVVIKQNIKTLAPDIVFLQELASSRQVEMILDRNDYLTHYSSGNCTAVRKGVFSRLINIETDTEADGFLHSRAFVTEKGFEISLLNMHALSPMRDPRYEKRGEQIRNMFNKIRIACEKGRRIIVAGDFNFDPYRFERFSEKFKDDEAKSDLKLLLEGWNKEFRELRPGGLRVVSTDKPTWFMGYEFSLDHVITNLKTRNCIVLDSDDNRIDIDHEYDLVSMKERFMDHRAVSATLLLELDPDTLKTWKDKVLYKLAKRY